MRVAHGGRRVARRAVKLSGKLPRRGDVIVPPFAAEFVTVLPYAGNGLLMNFEPFNP